MNHKVVGEKSVILRFLWFICFFGWVKASYLWFLSTLVAYWNIHLVWLRPKMSQVVFIIFTIIYVYSVYIYIYCNYISIHVSCHRKIATASMFSLHSQPCFRFCEICDIDARPKGQTSRVRESLRNDQQIYYLANLYKAAPWSMVHGCVDGCWCCKICTTGWWFGTWMDYFPFHIWDVILPIDFHIFQRGWHHQPGMRTRETTRET